MDPRQTVHLVGSIPVRDAREAMEMAATALKPYLQRYSDGETGVRSRFMRWQGAVFDAHPDFVATGEKSLTNPASLPNQLYRARQGIDPETIRFQSLGYAKVAIESYCIFKELKSKAIIPSQARFLVALPTAVAIIWAFVVPEQRLAVHQAMELALQREAAEICRAIQHDELTIQWDVCHEVLMLEGARSTFFERPWEEMLTAVTRYAALIPPRVELGFHLCYGDGGHKHTVEPKDLGLVVKIMNELARTITRPISYFHVPVPRDRDDDAYFAPLQQLRIHPTVDLFLGLIHFTDGVSGNLRRIATAKKVRSSFGIATECGFGRRDPITIPQLLEIHARTAAALVEQSPIPQQ